MPLRARSAPARARGSCVWRAARRAKPAGLVDRVNCARVVGQMRAEQVRLSDGDWPQNCLEQLKPVEQRVIRTLGLPLQPIKVVRSANTTQVLLPFALVDGQWGFATLMFLARSLHGSSQVGLFASGAVSETWCMNESAQSVRTRVRRWRKTLFPPAVNLPLFSHPSPTRP